MSTRPGFLREALAGAGIFASARALSGREMEVSREPQQKRSTGIGESSRGRGSPVPVQTPDVPILPHERDGDVKVFKLVAEPLRRKMRLGRRSTAGASTASPLAGNSGGRGRPAPDCNREPAA